MERCSSQGYLWGSLPPRQASLTHSQLLNCSSKPSDCSRLNKSERRFSPRTKRRMIGWGGGAPPLGSDRSKKLYRKELKVEEEAEEFRLVERLDAPTAAPHSGGMETNKRASVSMVTSTANAEL